MTKTEGRPHSIYLLHIIPPSGVTTHYFGIARSDQVMQRLARHFSGRGSRHLARVLKEGASVTLARTWPNASFEQERRFKRNGHYEFHCPVCRGDLDLLGDRLTQWVRPVPPPFKPSAGLDWASARRKSEAT